MLPENHNKKCFIPEIRDESSHESVLSGLTVEQSKAFKVHLADIQQSFIKIQKSTAVKESGNKYKRGRSK